MNTSGAAWWDTRRKTCALTGLQEAVAGRLDCDLPDNALLMAARLRALAEKDGLGAGLAARKGATVRGAMTSLLDTASNGPKPASRFESCATLP